MRKELLLSALLIVLAAGSSFAASPTRELRGAWVTSWANGFLTPEEADATIQAAKDANLNALFIEVRKVGDAYYKSNFEPKGTNKDIYPPADYDPLAYMIEKAHAAGIQIHAWMVTFRIWKGRNDPPEGHVVKDHPEWLTLNVKGENKNSEGMYLDPGVPEVKDYTVNVFLDVVKNYDIDGIHFDYVRYPGPTWGYNPTSVAGFNAAYNRTGTPDPKDPQWCQWRRDQVTEVVRRVYQQATKIKPNIVVSASTIPWGDCPQDFRQASPYAQVFQDWRSWMKEGILDANVPMNYKNENNARNAAEYRRWLNGFVRWRYKRHVYAGQQVLSVANVVPQVKATRARDVQGEVLFAFNQGRQRDALVQTLKTQVFQKPAVIPEMPWKLNAEQQASRQKFDEGIRYAVKGDLDKAIELLKASIADDPTYVEAHFRLGRCYARKGMITEATAKYQEVLKMDPNYAEAKKEIDRLSKMKKQSCGETAGA